MGATAGLKLAQAEPVTGPVISLVQASIHGGEAAEHEPRPPRQRTLIRAVIRAPGIPGQDVIVRNVSERGMRLVSRGICPHVGERLSISLPDTVLVEGDVRWVRGEEFGIELTADLDLRHLGLTNQRRYASDAGKVIYWLVDVRLRRQNEEQRPQLRSC